MKIVISPAKIMKETDIGLEKISSPIFLNNALELWSYLKSQNDEQLHDIWRCNEDLFKLNKARLEQYNLTNELRPALLVYDGLQFKKMNVESFTKSMWDYVNKNLRIISGLYGLLMPSDGINFYRLEMLSRINFKGCKTLYEYWGDSIYHALVKEDKCILNLASNEYFDVIKPYLSSNEKVVSVSFLSKNKKGMLISKSTEAKTCRGAMVKYLAEKNIDDFEGVKSFHDYDYSFSDELSNETEFVFVKRV